jgi:hypothetical protein
MKITTLLGLIGVAFFSLAQPTWAGPRGGGGGGGHFGGGGRVGGFAGGGSRAAPAFRGGGFQAAPAFRGAYFTGGSVGGPTVAPRVYGGNRMSAVRPQGFARSVGPSTRPYVNRSAAAIGQPNRVNSIAARSRATDPRISTATNRQPNRVGSVAGRNQVSNPRTSTAANPNRQTAANRQSFVRNHASERHDANWHRDWDRHHSHFHNHKVFVFVNGFWWGLDPSFYPDYAYDYYPADDYNPYDDSYGYPYDYSGNPYDYYNYSPYNNDDQSPNDASGQSAANATLSAVQSELSRLGYYNGAIDGSLGDQTEAALARYQEDRDLSVTGTVDAATLQSLGIR